MIEESGKVEFRESWYKDVVARFLRTHEKMRDGRYRCLSDNCLMHNGPTKPVCVNGDPSAPF